MLRSSVSLLLTALLVAPAMAQRHGRPLPAGDPFHNTGFARPDGGALLGVGPDYNAWFGPLGVDFTPALGKAAPHDLPLAYELVAVGRDGTFVAVTGCAPVVDGNTAVYAHGPVTARYELRTDGVKQSFVFSRLPVGHGDLLVRGSVRSELVAGAVGADGVDFTLPGIGGVRIGAVEGFDAVGKRVHGELRCSGGTLEFMLPAAFVDAAVLPLTVDPLIGAVTTLGGANNDLVPDIGYDATTDTWLVVWQRQLSLTNQDLRGQRLSGAGALVGGTLVLESSTTVSATQASIGNVNMRDAFVVAWVESNNIVARGVDAATGALTAVVNVAATADLETAPDVAGEDNETADDDVLVVWQNSTGGDIEACQVAYAANATLLVGAPTVYANGLFNTLSNPCIANHGGALGNHLICWQSYGSIAGTYDLVGIVVNRNLVTVAGPFTISNSTLSETNPDCDGDADNLAWVVAAQRAESSGTTTDLVVYPVSLAGTTPVVSPSVVLDGISGMDARDPAVCRLRNSVLVGWARAPSAGDYDIYVASLTGENCSTCEGNWVVESLAATTANFVAIAWRLQTSAGDDNEALLTWQSFDTAASSGNINCRGWTAADGRVDYLSAACGVGGHLHAGCPRPGNSGFRIEMRQAAPSTASFLLLSPARSNFACGPCSLIPDPYQGFVASSLTTNANGFVALAVPIPAAVSGFAVYAQWALVGTTCSAQFDLSDGAIVRVQ